MLPRKATVFSAPILLLFTPLSLAISGIDYPLTIYDSDFFHFLHPRMQSDAPTDRLSAYRLVQKKRTVLLSTSLGWLTAAGQKLSLNLAPFLLLNPVHCLLWQKDVDCQTRISWSRRRLLCAHCYVSKPPSLSQSVLLFATSLLF